MGFAGRPVKPKAPDFLRCCHQVVCSTLKCVQRRCRPGAPGDGHSRRALIRASVMCASENIRATAAAVSRKRLGLIFVGVGGQWMITEAGMPSGSLKMMVIASVGVIWPEASSVILLDWRSGPFE